VRILLHLSAMVLLVLGVGLVVDPWRPVSAVGLPDHLLKIPDLDLKFLGPEPDFVPGSGSLRIELVGAERLEMGERALPAAWVAFDADTATDCVQLAPTPIAAMDHDLAGG
jgi:hypothetical protein